MYALDLPVHPVTALLVIENPLARWNRTMNGHPKSQMVSPLAIRDALDGKAVPLPTGAWLARRSESGWYRVDQKPTDQLEVSRTLGWLAALEVEESVHWTKADGFQPRAGTLGLLQPAGDYTLLWADGQVRRIVVGASSPFGRGVFVFDNLDADRWGNPHPRGLYTVKENKKWTFNSQANRKTHSNSF